MLGTQSTLFCNKKKNGQKESEESGESVSYVHDTSNWDEMCTPSCWWHPYITICVLILSHVSGDSQSNPHQDWSEILVGRLCFLLSCQTHDHRIDMNEPDIESVAEEKTLILESVNVWKNYKKSIPSWIQKIRRLKEWEQNECIFMKYWVSTSVTPEFLLRMCCSCERKNTEGTMYSTQLFHWVGGGCGEEYGKD